MKTKLATAIASTLVALSAQCVTVTNTVTIISNIYNRIAREYYITNNVIHDINYNYNDFTTNTTVNYDVSQEAIREARNQADSARSSASSAASSASSAASSASSAASQYSRVVGAANSGISSINSATQSGVSSISSTGNSILTSIRGEKSWFDEHFGQMVTNVNVQNNTYTTDRIYNSDDLVRVYNYRCVNGNTQYNVKVYAEQYEEKSTYYAYTNVVFSGAAISSGYVPYVRMYKSNGRFYIQLYNSSYGAAIEFGEWLLGANHAPSDLPEFDSNDRYGSMSYYVSTVEVGPYLCGNLKIYDASGNEVDRVVRNSELARVAKTGSYNDLLDKPESLGSSITSYKYTTNYLYSISFQTWQVNGVTGETYWEGQGGFLIRGNNYTGTSTKTYPGESSSLYVWMTNPYVTKSNGRLTVHATGRNGNLSDEFNWTGSQDDDTSFPPEGTLTSQHAYWPLNSPQMTGQATGRFVFGNTLRIIEKTIDRSLNANLTVYGQNGKIGTLILDNQLNDLSNWVERVFQKK